MHELNEKYEDFFSLVVFLQGPTQAIIEKGEEGSKKGDMAWVAEDLKEFLLIAWNNIWDIVSLKKT